MEVVFKIIKKLMLIVEQIWVKTKKKKSRSEIKQTSESQQNQKDQKILREKDNLQNMALKGQ